MPKLKYGLKTNTRIKMFRSKWQYKRKGIGEKIECCLRATWGPRLYIDNPEPTLPLRNKESIRSSKKKQRFSNTFWTLSIFFHTLSTFLLLRNFWQPCWFYLSFCNSNLLYHYGKSSIDSNFELSWNLFFFSLSVFCTKKAIIQGIKKLDYFSIYRI